MLNRDFTEDQNQFRSSYRKFLEKEIIPNMEKWREAGIVGSGGAPPHLPEAPGCTRSGSRTSADGNRVRRSRRVVRGMRAARNHLSGWLGAARAVCDTRNGCLG